MRDGDVRPFRAPEERMPGPSIRHRAEELRRLIRYHNDRYYRDDAPEILV